MEPNQTQMPVVKTSAKDFFLNLGAIVALSTTVVALINLLFTVINSAYPQVNTYYYYNSTSSISFPVATLIIFFPVYVLLMWLLERGYEVEPQRKQLAVRRWLTYITLFVAGLALAGDLVTVLYFFIDGQELTGGFLLKVLSVFVITAFVFMYYISDVRNKLASASRRTWLAVATVLIIASIVWGFVVIGSPYTQRKYKYDDQKVMNLQNLQSYIVSYYMDNGVLPTTLEEITAKQPYTTFPKDEQTGKAYEYAKLSNTSYNLCADFNYKSRNNANSYPSYYGQSWAHPAGRYCFTLNIDPNTYRKPVSIPTL